MIRVMFKKLPDGFDEVRPEFEETLGDLFENLEIQEIRYVRNCESMYRDFEGGKKENEICKILMTLKNMKSLKHVIKRMRKSKIFNKIEEETEIMENKAPEATFDMKFTVNQKFFRGKCKENKLEGSWQERDFFKKFQEFEEKKLKKKPELNLEELFRKPGETYKDEELKLVNKFDPQKSSLLKNLEDSAKHMGQRDNRRRGKNYRGRKKKGKRREREVYVFEKKDKGNGEKKDFKKKGNI